MAEKHYIYGSGMVGCLYDCGPNYAETLDDAIDGLLWLVDGELSARYQRRMREDLREHGIHYYDRRLHRFVGAHYVEISECDCDTPEDHEE